MRSANNEAVAATGAIKECDECEGGGNERAFSINSSSLLLLDDPTLLRVWQSAASNDRWSSYWVGRSESKRVLDVGAGFGRLTLQLALHGAWVTFVDVAESNLLVLSRLCGVLGVATRCRFIHMASIESLSSSLQGPYDLVMALGSLHHAPRELIQEEMRLVLDQLRSGGSWLQLAYPMSAWAGCAMEVEKKSTGWRSGFSQPCTFHLWGTVTDGDGTPWAEWYELPKLMRTMEPHRMRPSWCGITKSEDGRGEFLWTELIKQ